MPLSATTFPSFPVDYYGVSRFADLSEAPRLNSDILANRVSHTKEAKDIKRKKRKKD